MKISYCPVDGYDKAVMRPVVGPDELPSPEKMTLRQLRDVPNSLLAIEKTVEEYIVEPLIRLARIRRPKYRIERQYRIGRGSADYAILRANEVRSIIEVKVRCRRPQNGVWSQCKDVAQAKKYATPFDCPFVLIDCDTIACFKPGRVKPSFETRRHNLTREDLKEIHSYLANEE